MPLMKDPNQGTPQEKCVPELVGNFLPAVPLKDPSSDLRVRCPRLSVM